MSQVSVRAFDLRAEGAHRGWNANSIWVRGADPSGHWANPPAPTTDDFSGLGPWLLGGRGGRGAADALGPLAARHRL
jgi:hypothetical protein